jgi:hypothetical protein
MSTYIAEIPTRVAGIPRLFEVEHYHQPPDSDTWASGWDYCGYSETEWRILDRRGRPTEWLERKLADGAQE